VGCGHQGQEAAEKTWAPGANQARNSKQGETAMTQEDQTIMTTCTCNQPDASDLRSRAENTFQASLFHPPLDSRRFVGLMNWLNTPVPLTTLTLAKLLAACELVRDVPPDPLHGARILYAHENMLDAARRLADAANGRLIVLRSRLVPPGHIVAMDGDRVACVIGPEN
jgi:hypothetical protein